LTSPRFAGVDGGCRAIDPVELGKAALVTPIVPRLVANSIIVAKATPEKIDAATATLRSMTEGRNHEMFMTGP